MDWIKETLKKPVKGDFLPDDSEVFKELFCSISQRTKGLTLSCFLVTKIHL